MNAPDKESARHDSFRDQCMLYGDFNRPVFLEEIVSFVRGASKSEIVEIREAIRRRASCLKTGGKKGRPRGQDDRDWCRKAFRVAWRRHVLEMKWPDIAKAEGLNLTKTNLRTIQRRRDEYAALIWKNLPPYVPGPNLSDVLKERQIQSQLRRETGIPFNTHPTECTKLVLALAPRGLRVEGNRLRQRAERGDWKT